MNGFEIERGSFRYDGIPALDGLSLSIDRGNRIALLGANGCGKTTLLRVLGALTFLQEGTLRFDGARIDEAAMRDEAFAFAFRRRVGLVFQNADAQLFNPTVVDELAFGPLQLRWPEPEIRERIEATLARFGIAHLRDRSPHRLSGGEKKRVCLASILILEPEVLLLDEPTAALDPQGQDVMIDLLADCAAANRTVVIATHDLGIVEEIADRCVVLHAGRVAAVGATREIVRDNDLLRRTGLLHAHRRMHTHR